MTYPVDSLFVCATGDASPETQFPAVARDEKRVLTFDFSSDLAAGETLSGTPVITVSVFGGADVSVPNLLNGSAALNSASTQVQQPITAALGLPGSVYEFECKCATTNAQKTLTRFALLPIQDD